MGRSLAQPEGGLTVQKPGSHYENLFKKVLGGFKGLRERWFLLGFTLDVDHVYTINRKKLGKLEKNIGRPSEKNEKVLACPEEFLSSLLRYMRLGVGGECVISDFSVCRWIEKNFGVGEKVVGGNAAIAADTLAALGAKCVLVVPTIDEETKNMFRKPENIFLPFEEGLINLLDVKEQFSPGLVSHHYVFEFSRGEKIFFPERFVVPRSNRFIASWDPAIREDPTRFLPRFLPEELSIDHCLFSGFHLLPDQQIGVVPKLASLLKGWREEKTFPVHLELGDFQSPNILEKTINSFILLVQSVGLNEDELSQLARVYHVKPGDSLVGHIETLGKLWEKTRKKIVFHTRPYSLSFFGFCPGVGEVEEEALGLATLVAASRFRYGRPASFVELGETLGCATILGKNGELRGTNWVFCPSLEVPTLVVGRTVGLGDAFAAGYILGQTKNYP